MMKYSIRMTEVKEEVIIIKKGLTLNKYDKDKHKNLRDMDKKNKNKFHNPKRILSSQKGIKMEKQKRFWNNKRIGQIKISHRIRMGKKVGRIDEKNKFSKTLFIS